MSDLPQEDMMENIMSQLYSQNSVCFVKYKNPLYGKDITPCRQTVENEAILSFKKILPLYSIGKLSTSQLVENVMKNIFPRKKNIFIPNGCCSLPNCPIKIFYDCVVDVIRSKL